MLTAAKTLRFPAISPDTFTRIIRGGTLPVPGHVDVVTGVAVEAAVAVAVVMVVVMAELLLRAVG